MNDQNRTATTAHAQAAPVIQRQPDCLGTAQPSTFHISELAGLARIRAMTKGALTQQWPTRRLPLCPPAHGVLVPTAALRAPERLSEGPNDIALILFLPDDFEPHLATLAARVPEVRMHELVSLRQRETYLSISVPVTNSGSQAARPSLPLTVWVRVQDIMDEYMDRSTSDDSLPVVLVARNQAALGHWLFDAAQTTRVDAVTGACVRWTANCTGDEKQRADDKATKYGERPWLFMRYELTNVGRRFAVNWAPVCTMRGEQMVPYRLEP